MVSLYPCLVTSWPSRSLRSLLALVVQSSTMLPCGLNDGVTYLKPNCHKLRPCPLPLPDDWLETMSHGLSTHGKSPYGPVPDFVRGLETFG